jgi:hypothetical protein
MKRLRRLARLAGIAGLAWAIFTELSKDPKDREWHGELGGVVPYDFRVPTPAKLQRTYWDTGSDKIVKSKAFGVGWTVNLAAIARLLGFID